MAFVSMMRVKVKPYLNLGFVMILSTLLSGCAWYNALQDQDSVRVSHIGDSSLIEQDQDLKKFYELQKRIEELENKLGKPAVDSSLQGQKANDFYNVNKKAEQAISYIRQKTNKSIDLINGFISSLKSSQVQESKVAADVLTASVVSKPIVKTVKNGVVSGALVRDDSGKVVKATTSGKKYNYSVVYVYPESQPWFDMWALLDSQGVMDKWRGKNTEKETYFIYVGAYYTPSPAERRQHHLAALTGAKPDIRVREGYQAVAMK